MAVAVAVGVVVVVGVGTPAGRRWYSCLQGQEVVAVLVRCMSACMLVCKGSREVSVAVDFVVASSATGAAEEAVESGGGGGGSG